MTEYDHAENVIKAQEAFGLMIKAVVDGFTDEYRDKDKKIAELEFELSVPRQPGKFGVIILCVLAYVYGAFFGMYMCPK